MGNVRVNGMVQVNVIQPYVLCETIQPLGMSYISEFESM